EHAVEMGDLGVEQLFAQVRRGVDEHARCRFAAEAFDEQRAAAPAVLRVRGVTRAPARSEPRYPRRGAASEDGEAQSHAAAPSLCGTLRNRRKKLLLVCSANASGESPRAPATAFAVSTT